MARSVAVAALAFGFATSWSSSARAADAVVTVQESVVRTEPYEAAPELVRLHAGDKVTADEKPWSIWRRVRLPDGRKGMVHDADIQVTAPGTSAAKAPMLQPLPLPGAATPDGVFVDVRTTEPNVRIDRIDARGMHVQVCQAPCRQVLPRNAVYFVDGLGGPGASFVLPNDKQQLTLNVKSGSARGSLGWAMIVIGGLAVGFGGVGTVVGPMSCAHQAAPGDDCSGLNTTAGLLIGGSAAFLTGILLVAADHPTVTTSDGVTLIGTGLRR